MVKISKTHKVLVWIICIWSAFWALVAGCFFGFNVVYAHTYVRGWSMLPTLNLNVDSGEKGDCVYYKRFSKNFDRDDIVIIDVTNNAKFIHSNDYGDYIIKRVIGVEGDSVNIEYDNTEKQYSVVVYNKANPSGKTIYTRPYKSGGYLTYVQFKAYIQNEDNVDKVSEQGVKVGAGEVFVLGDNWEISKDSSAVGCLKVKDVVGKIDIIVPKGENAFIKIIKHIFHW